MIRETLLKILVEFEPARKTEKFKGHLLASFIRNQAKQNFEQALGSSAKDYIVDASPGKGNWVNNPWINIMDQRVTTTAEDGYYPVYLFSEDQKTIVLELGQGEFQARKIFKKDTENILISRAAIMRSKVPEYNNKFKSNISINLKKGDKVKERWISSAAFGKVYKINKFPEEQELIDDLKEILKLYQIIISKGGFSEGNFNKIYVDQDQYTTSNEMKIIKHIDKELEIIKTNPLFIKELKRNSNYTCQACGLKYEKIYGNYSKNKDFIEAHHIEPKFKAKENAEINKKMSRTAKDFAMLCANCHRMIHRMMTRDGNRVISLDEFKESVNFKFKEKIKELDIK
jgi:5-methylcytosine-specific restriction protein A